uniref:Reverse transcriptase domain-containing protein n=1 Tax=Tanacetum cinerariifolium TaxID=118510 RepID=A0A699HXR2_TANCI|nr:reverse transcriptase domain-containing protein [Tanacetum cinerariifolium]
MCTRSSSNLPVVSPSNPSTSNPKRCNRRRSKQPFILEESPIDTMADQRTMAELLRAPTEGYAEAIVVPPILAEQFELKHSLINMMTSDQFFGLEKDNPHDHIRWGSPPVARKRTPAFYSHLEDLVSKFINEFFPLSRITNLRNEISNFQQRFDESFHEAWDRYKDLLRACPHHEIAKLTHAVNQQTSVVTTTMTAILKQFQATTPPASVKAVEEICVTCGDAHPYYQCLAASGNTFPELRDNIQGYVAAAAVNYNQGLGSLPSNTIANPKGELKGITTRSGIVLDGPTVPTPPPFINPGEDKRLHINITLADALILMPKYQKMLKALLFNKEKLQELANTPLNENYSAVILKKLPEKLGDPGKFLISCGFNELKCKALADLAGIARDVFVPVGKFTFPADFVIVDYEKMILYDGDERLTLNMRHDTSSYSNQPQKESINLINVFNNSSEDFIEDLFSINQPSGNPTFSSHPELTSPEIKDDIFNPEGGNVLPEKLLDLNSTKDFHPFLHVNPLSGSTTYSSSPNQLLEEFVDELYLIIFPPEYNDDLQFDIESDFKEIEYLLHHDPIKDINSSLKDSIDQINLANLYNNLVHSMPEMFPDEHALDYSFPPIFDEYDDDFFEVKSGTENVYDDPFDSKGEKIKESKLLIDELDLLCDFLPFEYDSIFSEDFSRVDALSSTNNEDKVFNPGILIQENPFKIITPIVHDKKLATSNASLVIEDCDPPPLYELYFFKEVPSSKMLLLFLSENEEKKFKPGIHTSEKVHSSLIPELSHQGYKVFKINQILKSLMNIFLFSCRKDTHILAVPCLHFYPLDQFKYGGIESS